MSADVRVVCLNFQGKPRSAFALAPEEALAVSTEAFPRSLPADARSDRGFRALKLFPAGACRGYALTFNGGAVDDWDRPVLSARVALVAPRGRAPWAGDFQAAGELLAALEGETEGSAEAARAVATGLAERSFLAAREGWARAAAAHDPLFIGRLAHILALCRDVLLIGPDSPAALQALTLAMALAPPARLSGVRVCTACRDPRADGREEVVFLSQPAAPARRSLWSRLSGRPGARERIDVDLAAAAAPEVRGGCCGARPFTEALRELTEAEAWPELSFLEMLRHVHACLEALLAGSEQKLIESAARDLPRPAARALAKFVKRCLGRER